MNGFAIGAGGVIGAILRYELGKAVSIPNGFPLSTLLINLMGCLFLSWFFTFTTNRSKFPPQLKGAIGTGFTGAFTTFSTFSVETLHLIQNHQLFWAISYILLSIIGGIILALAGTKLALLFVKAKGGER